MENNINLTTQNLRGNSKSGEKPRLLSKDNMRKIFTIWKIIITTLSEIIFSHANPKYMILRNIPWQNKPMIYILRGQILLQYIYILKNISLHFESRNVSLAFTNWMLWIWNDKLSNENFFGRQNLPKKLSQVAEMFKYFSYFLRFKRDSHQIRWLSFLTFFSIFSLTISTMIKKKKITATTAITNDHNFQYRELSYSTIKGILT